MRYKLESYFIDLPSPWSVFKEQIVIKLLEAHDLGDKKIALLFSDGTRSVFDVNAYCATRNGPLLKSL